MDSGTTEQLREGSGITEQHREDSGTMEKQKSLLFASAMDSGTTEQHREDLGITEQRREDSGTMEKREDSGTTEQRREDSGTMEKQKSLLFASAVDSGTTEQRREDSEITEQRREDSEITEQRREDSGTTEQRMEDLGTMEKRKNHIFKLLEDDGVSTVVLVGDTGMGKTWMAREISECAVREGLCYASLWLSVTEKYDINLLYESIAHQLSLSFITEEWGDEEEDIDSSRDAKILPRHRSFLVATSSPPLLLPLLPLLPRHRSYLIAASSPPPLLALHRLFLAAASSFFLHLRLPTSLPKSIRVPLIFKLKLELIF
ncbi:hypothetical protein LWI29_031956 [Acer saccharum]|uniref:NB-ARC domain-containing protein n=1 Tax=Acer saccharum TaxID=4024 RepID=A0AA39T897_ACESA|nr:hypothetical protein LWI29_031956 [Acer saccharum]